MKYLLEIRYKYEGSNLFNWRNMGSPEDRFRIRGLAGEPWVHLADGKELTTWKKEDEIVYNQFHRQSAKYAFYIQAFDFISTNGVPGDYHEYGCHRGRTFRMALTEARRHALNSMRFFAFDSFEGLPEATTEHGVSQWQKGSLTTSEDQFRGIIREHGIYIDQCTLVKGFYDSSLTGDLQKKFLSSESKISMVCIDCDLYESAKPVFSFIEPLLQKGTIVYIDDYYAGYRGSPEEGVTKAFTEFQKATEHQFEPFLSIGWWGRSFIVY